MNDDVLGRIRRLIPAMAGRAAALDERASFPAADLADLADAGALLAPLPPDHGGAGLGTLPPGGALACAALRALGAGNLAVGRVYEAHVNALRLVVRYGAPDHVARAARAAATGHLFALWVTDPPQGGVALTGRGVLEGAKQFCSAAGHASWAVVTAEDGAGGVRLAMVDVRRDVTFEPLAGGMQGMRAATTGQVHFTGAAAAPFGAPGDYLREPDFSSGAWRTSAVTLGGLDALVAACTQQLRARGRGDDPHQLARMGQAMIAAETARLWVEAAAARAEQLEGDAADIVAYVNFARLAVERAALEAIALVQRSLGVAAFLRPNPVERLCRDLATYLRQPAPDAVLTEAAAHRMAP